MLSDVNKVRKLPKYDWPERLVFITPGSHRIFTKKGVVDDQGNETLIANDDFHFVVVLQGQYRLVKQSDFDMNILMHLKYKRTI